MNNNEKIDFVKYSSRKDLEVFMLDSLDNDFRVVSGVTLEKYRKQPWFAAESVQVTKNIYFVPKFHTIPRKMTVKVDTKKEIRKKKQEDLKNPLFHAKVIQDKDSWCELF